MGSAFRRRLLWQFALVCLLSFPIVSWGQVDQPHSAQPRITQAPRIIQAIDESIVTRLKGNTHPLARPQFDRGAAPANLPMDRMLLVLRRSPEQESALTKLLDEQQDKSSPNYHKWLMPEEFGQKFGPAHQDIQAVTSWLQSHGFQVAKVAKGRTVVEFSGTAAQRFILRFTNTS
jgi:Pro-kumamolisin, activation domain